jgi:hypothetical protein
MNRGQPSRDALRDFDGVLVSARLCNILHKEGFKTWDEIIAAQWSSAEWLRIPKFGRILLIELAAVLARKGAPLDRVC